ncbi:DUF885 family protein [Pontixanthobacter aestiaquae]|uniref:DUF885 family protein n=1 Tax=Pontixanthobacter aestiaquae TaxID=1509367 RepID=A0A844ZAD9_9SPHN|nr:DUF885 family protein [Pontixanthobacter aestiaquae]MDN3645002.1 DUF885 family protein [Pontixanthobacter aestiaquae]MXO83997.1 DUF885 family protein [Pontixanthobacter aestiaquae]
MLKHSLSVAFTLALIAAAPAALAQTVVWQSKPAAADASADEQLKALYDDYSRWQQNERGEALPKVAPADYERRTAILKRFLRNLDAIPASDLAPDETVNAAVLRSVLTEQIEDARFREWEMPFNSDSSFWSYLAPASGFQTIEQYENYLTRIQEIPGYFDQHIANARAGLERGFSVPQVTLDGRDASLLPYASVTVEDNPFWVPIAQMPASFSDEDREKVTAKARDVISGAIAPAYSNLLTFLRDEYLPNARETLAAHDFPDGEAYYAQQIRQYTTLNLTADEIHAIGLREVARIEAAMRDIMAKVGFEGSIAEFNESLRTDPQFIAETPDELMGVASYVAKRVDGELGKYFGFLPRHRFSIRPVAPDIAPFYTAGRGGYEYCQMNTYDLPSRPLYNIPALTLHECAPGHSFQAAFQREQGETAEFRRSIYFSGMGEGWGLYVEYLGEEMGIYRTPYEKFGRLSYEMWRAARLVIDTGIHSQGWGRDRALAYLGDRTALSRHEVATEIDRYISWPGQALSYKLGEMQIRRLRAEAEEKLGGDFDIRKFHDIILALGSVPLPVLEERIQRFIADGGQGLPDVIYDRLQPN